ncbi:MAG: hypothetical protein WC729_13820 [Sphingomonas sp.]|uniref:hypothetical protein n=1 Tax=Sphingomonas sp. TaxID=28214 RepID=UPI0035633044
MILVTLMAVALAVQANPTPAVPHENAAVVVTSADFTSHTAAFTAFVDETATMPEAERVRLFRARFNALFPGFYQPHGRTEAEYDATVAAALIGFPAIREKYTAASDAFAQAFTTGQTRFLKTFPDYELNMPVYLVHSLGQMDGGSRTINGRNVMIFGADVIAKIHDETTIAPFLDHELFHLYHATWFPDCDALWCSLWQEGMAVYVASRMNPGASERQLLLTIPEPLPAAVNPRLREAMCLAHAKFDATEQADYAPFFFGRPSGGPFPPRFGYYLGYLLAQKIGTTMPLTEMAHMPPAMVRPLLEKAIAEYGACPPPAKG